MPEEQTSIENNTEHLLLIEPDVESLAPRMLLFFKPTELLQGEPFRLKLRISNKGEKHFPGGQVRNIKLKHQGENIYDPIDEETLSSLARDESALIDLGIWHPYAVGMMVIECTVKAASGEVRCYQKLPGSGKLELKDAGGRWIDFIPVSSKANINQHYTNIILILLTTATILYYISTLFFEFPL